MAAAPMSNRRPKRPDGGFHRSKRRSGLNALAMLEGQNSARKGLLGRILQLLRRRKP
jgi:hypothetical protein